MNDSRSQRLSWKTSVFQAMLVLSVHWLVCLVFGLRTGHRLVACLGFAGQRNSRFISHTSYTQGHFFEPIRSMQLAINRVTQGELDERVIPALHR
jgi:hypothetical protein